MPTYGEQVREEALRVGLGGPQLQPMPPPGVVQLSPSALAAYAFEAPTPAAPPRALVPTTEELRSGVLPPRGADPAPISAEALRGYSFTAEPEPRAPTEARGGGPAGPRYPPAWSRTSPARDVRAAFSVEKGVPYSPEFREAAVEGAEERLRLTGEADTAAREAAETMAGAQAAAQERADAMRRDFEARERARLDDLARLDEHIDGLSRDLADMPVETPSLFTGDFGTDLIRGLGAILMGVGAGATGQIGKAIDTLNERMLDNVRRQQQEYHQASEQLRNMESLYGRAYARFGDRQAAEQASLLSGMQMVDQELARFASMARAPETAKRAELARAELRDQMNFYLEQFRREGADRIGEQWRHEAARTVSGGGPPSKAQVIRGLKQDVEIQELTGKLAGGTGAPSDVEPTAVPGYGRARTKEAATATNAVIVANKQAERALDALEAMNESGWSATGAFGFGSKEYQDAQAQKALLVPFVAKIMAGGFAPSETDMARADGAVPDPTAIGRDKFRAKAAALRDSIRRQVETTLEQNVVGYGATRRRRVE